MTIFIVEMDQAVSFPRLGENMILTGWSTKMDMVTLDTCSAIVLAVPGTTAAGLYHFGESDITEDPGAQSVLRRMHEAIQPTECYVIQGTGKSVTPTKQETNRKNLIAHLRSLTSLVPKVTDERGKGIASVCFADGATRIGYDEPPNDVERDELSRFKKEREYSGGQIYWANIGGVATKTPAKKKTCVML